MRERRTMLTKREEEEETGGAGPLDCVGIGDGEGGAVPPKVIPFPALADLVCE